jgi:hypothetical protein
MPPQKTQISCPRCRKPVVAQIEQLFDVTSDPGAKQRLLGSISNFAVCQSCGYNGPLATPIVYHDSSKELLLTFFPGELGMAVNDQEKLIGPLITQVSNRLSPEKRKAYLLRPQSFLTYQSLIERVLGADGITPEMIKEQQKRVSVMERLLAAASSEVRSEIIKDNATLFDSDFFAIFSRLMEGAHSASQEQAVTTMNEIQKQLFSETEYGRKIALQTNEIQEAVKTLQSAGKSLDRERLLDILIEAPNDDRLNALVSFTRPGLDYVFFQSLTERLEKCVGEDRKKLDLLREKLLEITRKIDLRTEDEFKRADALLNTLLSSEDVLRATSEHLNEMNDAFVQALNRSLQDANKKNDLVLMPKLQQIVSVLQQASAPPPELALLEEMLETQDDDALIKLIETRAAEITPEFNSLVASVISRTEEQASGDPSSEDAKMLERLQAIFRTILKVSMQKNFGK